MARGRREENEVNEGRNGGHAVAQRWRRSDGVYRVPKVKKIRHITKKCVSQRGGAGSEERGQGMNDVEDDTRVARGLTVSAFEAMALIGLIEGVDIRREPRLSPGIHGASGDNPSGCDHFAIHLNCRGAAMQKCNCGRQLVTRFR